MADYYTRQDYEGFGMMMPKLPVYLRSLGHKKLPYGKIEHAPHLRCPFFEMIWCCHGIGEVTLYQQKFQLAPNDIFFYYPNEDHVLQSHSREWELYWITFDGPNAYAFFNGYGYERKMHSSEDFPLDLYRTICSKIGESSPAVFRSQLANLCQLLALAGSEEMNNDDPMESALDLIRKNLDNPALDVNFLADKLNCHRTTLARLFKQKFGRMPQQAIHDRRIHVSESLLSGTDLPVCEIARRCGFSNASSFCRFFQKYHHMTPLQYRKQKGV